MVDSPASFRPETRERVHRGARALAEACRATLGPRPHPVLVHRHGRPVLSDDGRVIRHAFHLEDPVEKLGAEVLKDAAERTEATVGDGTTTSLLLACALYSGGLRHLVSGASPAALNRGMERGLRRAREVLGHLAVPVRTRDETARVARAAAGGDAAVGELVADAFERVGSGGVVRVERGTGASLETTEGTHFDAGYLSPLFVTDTEREVADHPSPLVLLCSGTLASITPLLPLLRQVAREGRPLFIAAGDVAGNVMANLAVHELRGTLRSLVVRAPGDHDERRGLLEDLAAITGARVVDGDLRGHRPAPRFADLGGAPRVVASRETTLVMGGRGAGEEVEIRCKELRREIAFTRASRTRARLEKRLARLSGGIALLRVSGRTEREAETRRHPMERAVAGAKAAFEGGVVPGGGAALVRAAPAVEEEATEASGDEAEGVLLVASALELPARHIAENAGADGDVALERIRAAPEALGFDVTLREAAGPADPLEVVRAALENAVSVAGMLLLADSALAPSDAQRDAAPESPDVLPPVAHAGRPDPRVAG